MPLLSPKDMFKKAYDGGYAVGAFNVNNMEIVQGIMEAGKAENAPLILQVSAGARKYAGQNYIMKLMEAALMDADLPVVLHLDHGPSFEMCKEVIDGGFTSVMIDGSHLSYEENIALTKKVVEYAHGKGVWVEAELGRLAGTEEDVHSTSTSTPTRTRPWSSWARPGATPGHCHRHQPRGLQIQGRAQAGLRPPAQDRRTHARLPHRAARGLQRGARVVEMANQYGRATSPGPRACRRTCCARPPRARCARSTSTRTSAWP